MKPPVENKDARPGQRIPQDNSRKPAYFCRGLRKGEGDSRSRLPLLLPPISSRAKTLPMQAQRRGRGDAHSMRIFRAPQLFHAGITSTSGAVEFIADGIFLVVVLVIVLGGGEDASWRNLHGNRLFELTAFF